MSAFQHLSHRPHLVLAILLALIAFFLLTFAADRRYFQDEPLQIPEPILAEPVQQTTLSPPGTPRHHPGPPGTTRDHPGPPGTTRDQ